MNGVSRYFLNMNFVALSGHAQKENECKTLPYPMNPNGKGKSYFYSPYFFNTLLTFLLVLLSVNLNAKMHSTSIFTSEPTLVVSESIPNVSLWEDSEGLDIELNQYFDVNDDKSQVSYEILFNSRSEVAEVGIDNDILSIAIQAPGQTNVAVKASYGSEEITQQFVIGVKPVIEGDYVVSHFEDLTLEPESFWNGADQSGGFNSGLAFFSNNYNPEWFSWVGWSYSNISDNTTPGWINQYSAITGTGIHGGNYAVSYLSGSSVIKFETESAHEVKGFFITNSTYATLLLQEGDEYSKKFGGETGDDPDWFKLSILGMKDGTASDSVEFYLADYRFEDNTQNYIIQTWQWVELSSLGQVDSLVFTLSSTDVGDFGMNTPAYFCLDYLHVAPQNEVYVENIIKPDFSVYPNPTNGIINLKTSTSEASQVHIYTTSGQLVYTNANYYTGQPIDISNHAPGSYIVRILSDQQIESSLIIKR